MTTTKEGIYIVDTYSGVGKCVDRTVNEALEGYRARWFKDEDTPTCVALRVKECIIWATLVRGGGLSVQVSVHGVEDHKHYGLASKYVRKAKGKFILNSEDPLL